MENISIRSVIEEPRRTFKKKCLLVDYTRLTNCTKFFSAGSILLPADTYLAVGNTPYEKRHIFRAEPVYGKLTILH